MDSLVARLRAAGCVFAEEEARLLREAASTPAELAAMAERRAAGEPLEHVVGWAWFCGMRIAVESGVFVPRRRTEFLARQAAALTRAGAVVVDLCCGSGAIGAALGDGEPVELYAVDIDPVAVRCARRNLPTGRVLRGDLYRPLPAGLRGRVEVLVANVPYVPSEQIRLLPPEARLYEARTALDGGADGLDTLRSVAAEAPRWLASGGHLLIETGEDQAPLAAEVFSAAGLTPRVEVWPEAEATVVIGRR